MELAQEGLTDKNVKLKLKSDEKFRVRYLALYDMVNVLVNISQAKFSVLATTARKTPLVNSLSLSLILHSQHIMLAISSKRKAKIRERQNSSLIGPNCEKPVSLSWIRL